MIKNAPLGISQVVFKGSGAGKKPPKGSKPPSMKLSLAKPAANDNSLLLGLRVEFFDAIKELRKAFGPGFLAEFCRYVKALEKSNRALAKELARLRKRPK